MIENIFQENNIKITKQRKEIIAIILKLSDNATIKNIIKESLTCNKSTIYRILKYFYQKNIIDKEINYNNEIYYYLKEKHSHYITCIKCHKKVKIACCPIESIKANLTKEGYEIISHKIEIIGICKNCNQTL